MESGKSINGMGLPWLRDWGVKRSPGVQLQQ